MKFFDNISKRKKEKTIDSAIENAKQFISNGEYLKARYLLDSLTDEYRMDDIAVLRKKAYPVEVKTLANNSESSYECGYRSMRFVSSVKASDTVKDNCCNGCSYVGAEGKRLFCKLDEHEKYRSLAKEFSDYWGGKVFFVIEDETVIYILSVEADKELWSHDRVMAYRIENEDFRNAVYSEIKLSAENGIPVIEKYTPQHKVEKDAYIEKVKRLFSWGNYREVVEIVDKANENLSSDYRKDDMVEVYNMCRKSKDILMKLRLSQKKEAISRLDFLTKECGMDEKVLIGFKNDRLCASVVGEDGTPIIKELEKDDALYLLANDFEEELGCLVYHITENGNTVYLFAVNKEPDVWGTERPSGTRIAAIVFGLDECDYRCEDVNIFNNGGALGVKRSETADERDDKYELKEEAKARLQVLTEKLGLDEIAYRYWCEGSICCSRTDAEGVHSLFLVEQSSKYAEIISKLEKTVGCMVYHIIDEGEDMYLLNIHFDSGYEYGRLWEDGNTVSLIHCNSDDLTDIMFWDVSVSAKDGVLVIDCNDDVEDESDEEIHEESLKKEKDSVELEVITDDTSEEISEEQQLIDGYNAEQWFDLGMKYYNGDGVAKNYTNALVCMENAAKLGVASAMHNCCIMYIEGQGTASDEEKSFYWCRKAAENDHVKAMYNLSWIYLKGTLCKRDEAEGLLWLRKASENGHAVACFDLAEIYSEGNFTVVQDKAQALYWYEKAAELGNDNAMMKCFCAYVDGVGCEKDVDKGVYWLQEAAKKENADALYRLGEAELHEAKTPEDVKRILSTYLIPAANKGDADALFLCAEAFRVGSGVPKNETKALELYESSAKKGCELSQKFLLEVYTKGGITEPDAEKALYWKEKLAEKNAELAVELAEMYVKMGGDENHRKSIKFLKIASDLGSVKAMKIFAAVCRENKNEEYFFKYELMAAEHGDVTSMHNVAVSYCLGEGTEKDMKKALYWREKAAEAGSVEDQYYCSSVYYTGEYVEIDYGKSFFWLQKAIDNIEKADDGLKVVIYYNSALLYLDGKGTEKNIEKAFGLFEKAASFGEKRAYQKLVYYGVLGVWGNKDTAFHWAVKSAEDGDSGDLLYGGGCMYYKGENGVAVDIEESIRWIEKAAEFGLFDAMLTAGLYYYGEDSTKKRDEEKSLYWLMKAFDNVDNCDDDQQKSTLFNTLANLSRATDNEKTYQYYQMAAELGNLYAIHECCRMCIEGLVSDGGNSNAFGWAEQAAKLGNTSILVKYAELFEKGNELSVDPEEALRWYEKAAEYDDIYAMFVSAKMYYYGEGCTENPGRSFYWIEKAAQNGDVDSMVLLAENYDNGYGVEEDPEKACYWFQKAAESGNPYGMYYYAIKKLFGLGTEVSVETAKFWLKKVQNSEDKDLNEQIEKLKKEYGFLFE